MYSRLNMFAELNGVYYFNANDGIHGFELWRSDGTSAGTYMVKDINPGADSSNVNDIITVGNKLYFSAYDADHGQELWSSDGTLEGTQLVSDMSFGSASSNPALLTDVNGTLFFVTSHDIYSFRDQIWKTDGTAESMSQVYDFSGFNAYYGYNVRQLTNVNGQLFFTVELYFYQSKLFVTDGTTEGTRMVKDINPFGSDYPGNLTALNGLLYFSVSDQSEGRLWVSDGTDAGTHAVNNAANVSLPLQYYYYDNMPFEIKENTLFFQAYNSSYDFELYKYNTASSTANVALVKNIVSGTASSYPANLMNVNGTIFFTIGPVNADAQLWKTDGTSAGTMLVKDINPGGTNYYYGLINVNGILMFAYANDALGFELWKSDGTSAGTVLVKDILPGIYSSYPQFLSYKGGSFLFSANDGNKGFEVWKSDGSAAGTVMIKNINSSTSSSSYPAEFTYAGNNKTFFRAGTNKFGYELYVTNGTEKGTKITKDLRHGSFSSYNYNLTPFANGVAFLYLPYTNEFYLGKSDGTAAGTSLFFPLTDLTNGTGYITSMTSTDNLLYFVMYKWNNGASELWRSDGTSTGTHPIKSNIGSYYVPEIEAVGNTLYFTSWENATGNELWKSDGTTVGTVMVKDLNPGYNGSYPGSLYNFNGKLYFSADIGYGPYLYMTDGTSAGTQLVKPYLLYSYQQFAQTNTKLFFSAMNIVSKGYELFASDGTSAGTSMVKDIFKGPGSSLPANMVNGKNRLYFDATDETHGNELWVSDGTATGTHMVKDLTQGSGSSSLYAKANVNDELFFVQNDDLWQSNGTARGTHPVDDPDVANASNIAWLTSANDRLYFSAYNRNVGIEVFTSQVSGISLTEAPLAVDRLTTPSNLDNDAFDAKLVSNPFVNQLSLTIQARQQQAIQLAIVDASGKTLLSDRKNIAAGNTMLSYKTNNWSSGFYFIKITTPDGRTVSLKAVK